MFRRKDYSENILYSFDSSCAIRIFNMKGKNNGTKSRKQKRTRQSDTQIFPLNC